MRRRTVDPDFPNRLRELRELRGLPRVRLATLAGLSHERVRSLEYLPGAIPRADEIRRLARALSVSEDVLTGAPAARDAA